MLGGISRRDPSLAAVCAQTITAFNAVSPQPGRPTSQRGQEVFSRRGDSGFTTFQLEGRDDCGHSFNKTGTSRYHLITAHPNVFAWPSRLTCRNNQGVLLQKWAAGVVFCGHRHKPGGRRMIKNPQQQPWAIRTHLPIYLTNNVLLHVGKKRAQLLCDRVPRNQPRRQGAPGSHRQ